MKTSSIGVRLAFRWRVAVYLKKIRNNLCEELMVIVRHFDRKLSLRL